MAFQGFTMPPPYGGLDLVSPIDNMDPASALELVNVFPGPNAPTVRFGYESFATIGATTPIVTLASLQLKDGTTQLVATTSSNVYKITSGAVSSSIKGATTVTNGEFQTVTYANNLYLCNGVDDAKVYIGTGNISDVTFTGVTKSNLINVTTYKERLYFVEKSTAKVWYGGLQVTGVSGTPALTSFDFQYVFTKGGFLVGIGSFSTNTSMTSQDYFWACSSEGEVVFYNGTYAGDPTSWSLAARYYIGKPMGYRAFVQFNNDVWVITEQGIVPISGLFMADPEAALEIVSRKVNPLISEYAALFPFDHQWTGFFWPQGRRIYINLPITGSSNRFLVYSIDTKGWTLFQLSSDDHACSSCLFNTKPYYASSTGVVWKGETGQSDAVTSTDSQPILFAGRTAFNFYGSRSNYKAFKDIRPILKLKRGVSLYVGLDVDFRISDSLAPLTTSGVGSFTPWGSPWGVAPGTSLPVAPFTPVPAVTPPAWSAGVEYVFDRYATKGQGHCAAVRFAGSLKSSTMQILGFEVRYDMGGQV